MATSIGSDMTMSKSMQHTSRSKCVRDRLRAGDRTLFRIPGLDHPISINEIHAVALGLIALPIGERGFALQTIVREPHYFVAAFALAYAIGRRLRLR